ncbi:PEX3 [Candida oxycetoniae]|uniref:Peroxin-3 n=1 Tax=Candida oxycetoniae TaxID=497107 RepID=A0AAI9T0N2_9ASCO|nr:PEX3 [Candida oxycetoniae]KAI3405850.1 PEX3 [Candida oxycetoniae]
MQVARVRYDAFTCVVYLLINEFIVKKFRNYQNALRQELMFKQQIKQRFIQTQQDCYYTILALLPVLAGPIIDALPVELITQALRMKKGQQNQSRQQQQQQEQQQQQQQQQVTGGSNSELTADNLNLLDNNNDPESKLSVYMNKSKVELWNLLKIKTITRTLTLMYSISGLLLVTRLQLNILARRSYLESAILLAGVKNPNNDIDPHENYIIEQSYLSLSWWLLNKGWHNLSLLIEAVVVKKFENINPKTELGVVEFEMVLSDIIGEINANNKEHILANLFPINYPDLLETVLNTNPDLIHHLDIPDSNLTKLINETNAIMLDNSLYFFDLLNSLIITDLQTLTCNLSANLASNMSNSLVMSGTLPEQSEKITEIPIKAFKLASFLAQLSVQNGIMVNNDDVRDNRNADANDDANDDDDDDDIKGILNSLNNMEGFESNSGRGGSRSDELSGNVYINTLDNLEELDDFSASIYSNFE